MLNLDESDRAAVAALLQELESGAVTVADILREAWEALEACGIPK